MTNAIEFVSNCSADLLAEIPSDLLAAAGEEWFYVTEDLMKSNRVRIVLESIQLNDDDSISFKIRFAAKMSDGSLVQLRAGGADGDWLHGFRSGKLRLSLGTLEQLFTSAEIQALHQHAAMWSDPEIDMFSKEYVKQRLYMTVRGGEDAAFRYRMVERQHPTDGYSVVGITQPSWMGLKLIGSGLSSAEEVTAQEFTVKLSTSIADVARRRMTA